MPKVVLSESIHPDALSFLGQHVENIVVVDSTRPEVILRQVRDADALIVKFAKVTKEIIDNAPKLKVIGKHGIGVETIDVMHATRKGIYVVNVPYESVETTAEFTIAMILSLLRKIPQAHAELKRGVWRRDTYLGENLEDIIIGIIGLGKIGRAVAVRLKALKVKGIKGFDPYLNEAERSRLSFVDFVDDMSELLSNSDLVTLHVPLNSETKGMLNRSRIFSMKKGAYLVNTSRGEIIEEEALIEALREGYLAGAALDVFVHEHESFKLYGETLLKLENVVLTPHIAAYTRETQRRIALSVAKDVIAVLQGKNPKHSVNIRNLRG